jgi:hypothetical protein
MRVEPLRVKVEVGTYHHWRGADASWRELMLTAQMRVRMRVGSARTIDHRGEGVEMDVEDVVGGAESSVPEACRGSRGAAVVASVMPPLGLLHISSEAAGAGSRGVRIEGED